jgi:hypothetical protein
MKNVFHHSLETPGLLGRITTYSGDRVWWEDEIGSVDVSTETTPTQGFNRPTLLIPTSDSGVYTSLFGALRGLGITEVTDDDDDGPGLEPLDFWIQGKETVNA